MLGRHPRRATDWWCGRCRRPLRNDGNGRLDAVTKRPAGWIHDGCGGRVDAGGRANNKQD